MVYALGFTLEKLAAMQEHGVKGNSLPTCRPHFSLSLEFSLHSWNMGALMLLYCCGLPLTPS